MSPEPLLAATPILDYTSETIQSLIDRRDWRTLSEPGRVQAAYEFVRNEIEFGYNRDDALPASEVLAVGYGQCNTKTTLLMALLRALDIPCRFHGFTVRKSLQRGIVPEVIYPLAPPDILHSWVEVFLDGQWITLEGFILDARVLAALQAEFPDRENLCAYGVGTDNLHEPGVTWSGRSTFIQHTGINQDLGTHSSPDEFYARHQQLRGVKGWLYRTIIRHWMNLRVRRIRQGRVPPIPGDPEAAPTISILVKKGPV